MTMTKYVFYALAAYGSWGLFPVFWKQLEHIDAYLLIALRVAISCATIVLFLWAGKLLQDFKYQIKRRAIMVRLAFTSALITSNWGLYIWAINNGHIVEASLGYFMTPLMNIALGVFLLNERLGRARLVAVLLALLSLALMVLQAGVFPWIALTLGLTFAFYGLIRKRLDCPPLVGLAIEILFATPLALYFIAIYDWTPVAPLMTINDIIFLTLSGAITIFPLMWFTKAVRGLKLSTIGLIQYLSPSLQFMCGVFIYQEPFGHEKWLAFSLVWVALAIVTTEAWVKNNCKRP